MVGVRGLNSGKGRKMARQVAGSVVVVWMTGEAIAEESMSFSIYFEKILEVNGNPKTIQWEVSFHSDVSLNRINEFAQELNIDPSHIKKFRLGERLLS